MSMDPSSQEDIWERTQSELNGRGKPVLWFNFRLGNVDDHERDRKGATAFLTKSAGGNWVLSAQNGGVLREKLEPHGGQPRGSKSRGSGGMGFNTEYIKLRKIKGEVKL